MNNILLEALAGKPLEHLPVWLMRQAGRILPEYKSLRAKVNGFKELVSTPELAAEVTLQPIYHLKTDAAIIFSDILVIPEALGLPYSIIESKGPYFEKTLDSLRDIENLDTTNIAQKLDYVRQAIFLTKKELANKLPLIGFAGSPFTVLCYMVEGQGSKNFSKVRKLLYQNPDMAKLALEKITQATIDYLNMQIEAGVDVVQVFDSWGSILPDYHYKIFSLPYLNKIAKSLKKIPKILYIRGELPFYEKFKTTPYDALSIDYPVNVERLKSIFQGKKTLQGNLDPAHLYADKKDINIFVKKMIQRFGKQNYIVNLGQGVYPDTPLDNVKAFINAVREN